MSKKQKNETSAKAPVKLTRAEKKEIQAVIRKYKGDGKPHSAQASIPYEAMYQDGVCRVTPRTFSKCIEFTDISYQLAQADTKTAIFENLCDLYNYLDASIHVQFSFINRKIDPKQYAKSFEIRAQGDDFDDIRSEYSDILQDQLVNGNNGLMKRKFMTYTIEADSLKMARARLRRMKEHDFEDAEHASKGRKASTTLLSGYTGILDGLLKAGVTNSAVCLSRLRANGYHGGKTIVKDYIAAHQHLVPPARYAVAPQGNRGRRYTTGPGEAFQMDWGFTKVQSFTGEEYSVACFAMVCHHCGERYVEFFPNAKQENLFIGMLHGFRYMGVPQYILTDNMKSVVIRRDQDGHPLWQKDYEQFMRTVGFQTKLCKPRHPFTKGKVERLVRFVKDNFLAGRSFWNVTDLNLSALDWCDEQNTTFHRGLGIPQDIHRERCGSVVTKLNDSPELLLYLCPERRISFDGFVNYEGRRFGVPYTYGGKTVRVMRNGSCLYIYSADMARLLATHEVTWAYQDSFCANQYAFPEQPEEFPSMPVKTVIRQLPQPSTDLSFEKFNFTKEDDEDD